MPANAGDARDLGREDPLEEGTAAHSSVLAWSGQRSLVGWSQWGAESDRELSSRACMLRLGKAELLPHLAQAMATDTISVPPRGPAWSKAPASTPSGLEWVMLPAGQRVPAWGGGRLASLFIAKAGLAEGACLLSLSACGSSEPEPEPRSCPPDLRRWHPEPQGAVLAADPVGHTQAAGPL